MSLKHVPTDIPCLPSRSVTRRDALRLFIGAGICATVLPGVARAQTTQEKLDAAQMGEIFHAVFDSFAHSALRDSDNGGEISSWLLKKLDEAGRDRHQAGRDRVQAGGDRAEAGRSR